jgi:hypothetical protein
MTTNCRQLSTPNSVSGDAILATASHGTLREAPRAVGGKPTRTGGVQRRGAEAARQHLPGVTTCGRPRSYGLRQVDAEAVHGADEASRTVGTVNEAFIVTFSGGQHSAS